MGIPAGPAASCYRSGWAWSMEIKITAPLSFELSGVVCRFISGGKDPLYSSFEIALTIALMPRSVWAGG